VAVIDNLNYSLHIRLKKEEPFFGPGVMELLQRVADTGSIQTAAAQMNMSYSKAWKIIKTAEKGLDYPLMTRRVGGVGGGSSELTEFGRDFINRYAAFQREVYEAADKLFQKHFGDVLP